MSTILKALRRLEEDKAAAADRPLHEAVTEPGGPGPAAPSRARWVAGVLAAATLGAGGVLVLERGAVHPVPGVSSGPTPQPAAAPPAPPAVVTPVAAVPALPAVVAPDVAAQAPRVALPVPVSPPPGVAPDAEVAPVAAAPLSQGARLGLATDEAQQVRPAERPKLPEPSVAASAPFVPPTKDPALRMARAEPRVTAAKPTLPSRAAADEDAGAVVAEPVTRGSEDASAGEAVRTVEPARHAEPVARRVARSAPAASSSIAVLRTVWHPRPERRTALLEAPGDASPREYREGERVGALTLLRIEPSGVVFERDGIEVREKIAARP